MRLVVYEFGNIENTETNKIIENFPKLFLGYRRTVWELLAVLPKTENYNISTEDYDLIIIHSFTFADVSRAHNNSCLILIFIYKE